MTGTVADARRYSVRVDDSAGALAVVVMGADPPGGAEPTGSPAQAAGDLFTGVPIDLTVLISIDNRRVHAHTRPS
ncbi:hypothetical protein [Corynebacterium bovis]|uniref:hypothetical protein n=1 Tax=Corynebacterium bovis TaxID=36808 RepID=UPI000F632F38|nr:hypothetical protein [Corynebacterium bovis]MDN8578319.1 hypothetical protein [Corynebacterium bovis]RRO90222.1 hypothetical protein CXF30_01030 [Corynebacterium bovis]